MFVGQSMGSENGGGDSLWIEGGACSRGCRNGGSESIPNSCPCSERSGGSLVSAGGGWSAAQDVALFDAGQDPLSNRRLGFFDDDILASIEKDARTVLCFS